MIAYDTDRGSCWFTNNSFTHALNPVLFIYCKENEDVQNRINAKKKKKCEVIINVTKSGHVIIKLKRQKGSTFS